MFASSEDPDVNAKTIPTSTRFVHIPAAQRVRILDVPGVLTRLDGGRAEPHPLLTVGQRGRIRSGALAGMEGIVVRVKNNYRVVLTVHLIIQNVAVEVGIDDIELLDEV